MNRDLPGLSTSNKFLLFWPLVEDERCESVSLKPTEQETFGCLSNASRNWCRTAAAAGAQHLGHCICPHLKNTGDPRTIHLFIIEGGLANVPTQAKMNSCSMREIQGNSYLGKGNVRCEYTFVTR